MPDEPSHLQVLEDPLEPNVIRIPVPWNKPREEEEELTDPLLTGEAILMPKNLDEIIQKVIEAYIDFCLLGQNPKHWGVDINRLGDMIREKIDRLCNHGDLDFQSIDMVSYLFERTLYRMDGRKDPELVKFDGVIGVYRYQPDGEKPKIGVSWSTRTVPQTYEEIEQLRVVQTLFGDRLDEICGTNGKENQSLFTIVS